MNRKKKTILMEFGKFVFATNVRKPNLRIFSKTSISVLVTAKKLLVSFLEIHMYNC